MLLSTVWCHPKIPSTDGTACLRWLLSPQGLENNGVAQMGTVSAPGTLAAHSLYICIKVVILILVSDCICAECAHSPSLMLIILFSHHNYL